MRGFSARGHFRSRNKDGGHAIRSAVVENPMIHANLMPSCILCLLYTVNHKKTWHFIFDYNYDISSPIFLHFLQQMKQE